MVLEYTRTTIWAARFSFGTIIVTDTRATTRGVPNDHYEKFHVISDNIVAACSGSTRVIDMCLQILRNTPLPGNGENVPQEILVAALQGNEELMEAVRALRMRSSSQEPEGAKLLLVNNIGEAGVAVCLVIIGDTITCEFSRNMGCGSGWWAALPDLGDLPLGATREFVISKAIAGFIEANKRDSHTGGHAVILISDDGKSWDFEQDYELFNFKDWGYT